MTRYTFPQDNWTAICPNHKRLFYLGYFLGADAPTNTYQLVYPKGNPSEVTIPKCPICNEEHTFSYYDLGRPPEIVDRERKEFERQQDIDGTKKRVGELQNEVTGLRDDIKALREQLKEKDGQIDKFADSYVVIAKYITDTIKPQQPEKPKVNYEGANP